MNTKNLKILVLCLLLISFLSAKNPTQARSTAQEQNYIEDFEDGVAEGWDLEEGWEIITQGLNHVLFGQGHAWANSNQSFQDYHLSFRLKLQKGEIHLVSHMNDTGRYFIGFNAGGSTLNKQFWPNTFIDNLTNHSTQQALQIWHQVEIIHQGTRLTFIVNGITEWTYNDPEPLSLGNFAFETLDNSQAFIDDVVVSVASFPEQPAQLPSDSLNWIYTGGPLGGLGYDVRMHPQNPDTMFVTDSFAGVFKSLDGGTNWFPTNEGINVRRGSTGDVIPIFSLTIDPLNSDIIWAGTQEMLGIFKSTDRGNTWQKMTNGVIENYGISFRGFTMDPTNSDVVYAAAEISSYEGGRPERRGLGFDMVQGVVYKTVDGGMNWRAVWRGENLARYVWIDPRDTNVLYLSTGIFDREAYNSDPATYQPGGEGILKSIDGGQTWFHINNGLENLYVGSLFMHPENSDILLAGTGNIAYFQGNGVYITTDGGASWQQTLQDDNITSVEFSSSNPEIAYAGGFFNIYRSEDGGFSWQDMGGNFEKAWGAPSVMGGWPIDFQIDPRNPDRIFVNSYGGGNFLSENGGMTWVDASRGYTGANTRKVVVDPDQPARVIAVSRTGIFTSYDGGSHWEGLNYQPVYKGEWTAVAINPTDPDHIIAGCDMNYPLARSQDGGYTWIIVEDLEKYQLKISWSDIVFAPSNPEIVYASTSGTFMPGYFDFPQFGKGIFISKNGGKTWMESNDTLIRVASIASLAVHPQYPQIVYAMSTNQGLLKTEDGGTTWETINGPFSTLWGIVVAVNPVNPDIIYASFDRQALFISRDSGQSWVRSASGMPPEASITSIVFDPMHPLEVIYASDIFSGVYRSEDGGQTWQALNTGLTMRAVNGLAISGDGLHLYAATEGAGVFRLDLSGKPPKPAAKPQIQTPNPTKTPQQPTSIPTNIPTIESLITPIPSSAEKTGNESPQWLIPTVGIGLFLLGTVSAFLIVHLKKKHSQK